MTTLIKNVIVVDGSGRSPIKGDVLVRDNKILAIGSFPQYKADKIIFGNEGYLTPGFIDPNVSSDRYLTLFQSPLHKDFLKQGVTSIMIGQCGFSLAPSFYGTNLEHIESWSRINRINVNWKSVGEFLKVLEGFGLGVNVGTLVGHEVIREGIVKDLSVFRNLTSNELRVFRSVLSQSIQEGAFGMSTGLGYFPYQNTSYHELRALADVLKENKAIYATHLRNEREKLFESVDETIRLSQEMSLTTIISHFRPLLGFEDQYEKSLALIEEKSSKANVYFDCNPFNSSAASLDTFLPEFIKGEEINIIFQKLQDKELAKKFISALPKIDSKKMIILNAPTVEFLNGKTLYEFAKTRELSTEKALIKLMEVTKLKGVVLYENLNQEQVSKAMFSSRALISTNSPNFDDVYETFKPDRAVKNFSTYFKQASQNNIGIEKAVAKTTGLLATIFNIDGRGFISDGYFADLNLMTKDFDIAMVMVNGQIMVENGDVVSTIQKGLPAGKQGNGSLLRKSKK
jgi:N-acyl-D-amino-acid deacylase